MFSQSGLPYDLSYLDQGVLKYIDVKGTPSAEKDIIFLSEREWPFMFTNRENYALYCVYRVGYPDASISMIDFLAEEI